MMLLKHVLLLSLLTAGLLTSMSALSASNQYECYIDDLQGVQNDIIAQQIAKSCIERYPLEVVGYRLESGEIISEAEYQEAQKQHAKKIRREEWKNELDRALSPGVRTTLISIPRTLNLPVVYKDYPATSRRYGTDSSDCIRRHGKGVSSRIASLYIVRACNSLHFE